MTEEDASTRRHEVTNSKRRPKLLLNTKTTKVWETGRRRGKGGGGGGGQKEGGGGREGRMKKQQRHVDKAEVRKVTVDKWASVGRNNYKLVERRHALVSRPDPFAAHKATPKPSLPIKQH